MLSKVYSNGKYWPDDHNWCGCPNCFCFCEHCINSTVEDFKDNTDPGKDAEYWAYECERAARILNN